MKFKIKRLEGDAGSEVEVMRLSRETGSITARTEHGGARTVLLDGVETVGHIEYGPSRPPAQTLVPRSVDPSSSLPIELRSRSGTVWQERSAIIGARRRALKAALDGQQLDVWQSWGRLRVAAASGSTLAEVDVRRGTGSASGDEAAFASELLLLMLASTVTRHLSSLST